MAAAQRVHFLAGQVRRLQNSGPDRVVNIVIDVGYAVGDADGAAFQCCRLLARCVRQIFAAFAMPCDPVEDFPCQI